MSAAGKIELGSAPRGRGPAVTMAEPPPLWPVPGAVGCEGCGQYHGSLNKEMNCLREKLRAARDSAAVLPAARSYDKAAE